MLNPSASSFGLFEEWWHIATTTVALIVSLGTIAQLHLKGSNLAHQTLMSRYPRVQIDLAGFV